MAKVNLSELVSDFTIYPRNEVSSQSVSRIVDAMRSGLSMPPIIVDRKSMRIVDGFHRVEAARRLKLDTIDAELRDFKNDAELFAESIRTNIGHGRAFDSYDIRRCVIRLEELGIKKQAICELVRVPPARLDEITRGFARDTSDESVPLKRGLSHFAGKRMGRDRIAVVERSSGMEGTYHARQLIALVENDMWRPTLAFVEEMDRLVALWKEHRPAKAS